MKKILITGSSGFISSELINSFIGTYDSEKYQIHAVTRGGLFLKQTLEYCVDLNNKKECEEIIESIDPDIIIHMAGNPSTKPDHSNELLNTNTIMTNNILSSIKRKCMFIYASTVLVYGNQPTQLYEYSLCYPTSMYGISKLASEYLVQYYHDAGIINGKILRLCATVGPNLRKGILYDFIKKAKSDSKTFEIFGDSPGSIKPYCHTNNVFLTIKKMIDLDLQELEKINLSPQDNISSAAIAKIVMNYFGIDKKIVFLGEKSTWFGDNKYILTGNSAKNIKNYEFVLPSSSKESILGAIKDNEHLR